MNDGWFSVEFGRNLVWFSLLSVVSVLSVYVERGAIARSFSPLGGLCLR